MRNNKGYAIALTAFVLCVVISACAKKDDGDGGGGGSSNARPTVLSTFPANNAQDVSINTNVIARFSEDMDALTITSTSFTVTGLAGAPVSGTVSYDPVNRVADFLPLVDLAVSTTHTATITVGATDTQGLELAMPYVWSFTTGIAPDITPPTVTSTDPVDMATNVPINQIITALFDEQMDSATVDATSFTLMDGLSPVSGSVACPGTTASFTPDADLAPSTTFTATLTTQIIDLAGNALATDYVWTFETGTVAALGPAPVNLGTAGNYVLLSKAGISTTGTTSITGDIGLSPAAASYFTGFGETMDSSNEFATSPYVSGQMYASDYTPPTPSNMTTAVLDMETAFTDAAGRATPTATELGAGNISGMTLAPGLYKWGTDLIIPTVVTLSGATNDVWIFQVAGDFLVGSGAMVTLAGGAQAKNVFWQASGQVVLGTGSNLKGIVLCQTQIVMETGAVFNGRALAQTAITLDANAVTEP